jgi:hypothetical protein
LVKLTFAAPASFLSVAAASQAAVASVSHFFMKLVSAAPRELLVGRLRLAGRLRLGCCRLVALLVGLVSLASLSPIGAQSQLILINIHAWDCPPCIRWHNTERKKWESSSLYKQVRYVEIDSPTIRQAYDSKYWPADLHPLLKLTGGHGVPRYLIVKDGNIVSDQYGVDHWSYTMADLAKLLPASASAPIGAPKRATLSR